MLAIDNIAPTLYWTQLEAALAVVSACLPTMRPLFHGFSPESALGSFRTKIYGHRRLDKSSQSSKLPSHSAEYQSSLYELTKPTHAASVGTHIESKSLDDEEAANNESCQTGIRVYSKVTSHSEAI